MEWSFECETYGKWILAGEHAVLRGAEALVFPIAGKNFRLRYRPEKTPLKGTFHGPTGAEYRLLFWGVLENALSHLGQERQRLSGEFEVHSNLPLGAGLGASAALCGAVTRWCESQGFAVRPTPYDFARVLENFFHGESSGVDIAVALSGRPLSFFKGQPFKEFLPLWKPFLYLSYCGHRGMTADCVAKVKELILAHPAQGAELDGLMKEAVKTAKQALLTPPSEGSFLALKRALHLAEECYRMWGLVSGELHSHMEALKQKGAQAVKPTGSGGGGFVLSLWAQPPTGFNESELIPCF